MGKVGTVVFATMVIVIFVILGFVALNSDVQNRAVGLDKEHSRLIKIYYSTNEDYEIYYDKETKVEYLIKGKNRGGGITVLVDQEGKPLLYEGE